MTTHEPFQPVHELVLTQAATRPHAVAVIADDRAVDYRTLAERSLAVARRLAAARVQPDQVVGLAMPRTVDGLAGMLGILIAGGAYLYLDPHLPAARARHMCDECAIQTVLTTAGTIIAAVNVRRIDLPPCRIPAVDARPAAAPAAGIRPQPAAPDQLAYVVYTSGSTGLPRGVAVEHGAVANMTRQLARVFGVGAGSRMLQFAAWSWDAAVCEILVPLTAGGTVVIAPDGVRGGGRALADFLRAAAVQVVTVTPSVLAATPAGGLPHLRTVVAVGEPCPPDLPARWAAPGRRILNGYGPTEATVAVSVGQILPGQRVHIGAPLPGVAVRVTDPAGRPVRAGSRGQLVVSGVGLARGYLAAPASTGAAAGRVCTVDGGRFFRDPQGVRWFATGDRVRQRVDGTLVHLGRLDDQVQIRGYRVEPGEVEATLRALPAVAGCAVTVHTGRIVAYVVPADPGTCDPVRLAAAARLWLPAHMLPDIRLVDRLPLTASGKLDRAGLRRPPTPGRPPTGVGPAPAGPDPMLDDVLALVRRVLDIEQIQPGDDVFDRGGHSLLAAELSLALSARFGIDLPALAVVDHPTPAGLASLIRAGTRPAGGLG